MGEEYTVVGEFVSHGKSGEEVKMVVVRDSRGACTMSEKDWKWVYGPLHGNKWKNDSAA